MSTALATVGSSSSMRGPRSFSIQLEAAEPERISSRTAAIDPGLAGERERLGGSRDMDAAEELVDGLDHRALAGRSPTWKTLSPSAVEQRPRRREHLVPAPPP